MAGRLILYDTSNFIDFPIGGQLTSITNFLRFLSEEEKEAAGRILLVGVTTREEELGKWCRVRIGDLAIEMLPVAVAETDLGHTAKSLRLQYAKGLLRYGRLLRIRKADCNYIHTPEAYGVIKFHNPAAVCVIFSHGSYFNMERGFRFFQHNPLIKKGFMLYIKKILKNAAMIFVLDEDSRRAYETYNTHLVTVHNSVVCPKERMQRRQSGNLIFVGRLSKDKNVEPIIQAVKQMEGKSLLVVGDGEEWEKLSVFADHRIRFMGAVPPEKVKEYMGQADILVMNSLFEGVPMTILEALSQGIPVISTPVGGIPTVLSFGLDSEDTDGSAEQICRKTEKIYAAYETYAENAFQKGQQFDYKTVNREIFQELKRFW